MLTDRSRILIETITRLLHRGAIDRLKKVIGKGHEADLIPVFRSLSLSNQRKLFQLIDDPEIKGFVISELDEDIIYAIIDDLTIEDLVEIMEQMPDDDRAALIKMLPEEKAESVLEILKKKGSEDVEGLLLYAEETAGSIMTTDFMATNENMTAKEVIELLQSKEYKDIEMPFYVYVVDEHDHLVGVSSIRQLVLVPPGKPLKDFMANDVIFVTTDVDQEEVARIVARYNFLAVPVVDQEKKMVGIVTVDDIIDVIREEATEDILKMAGVGEEFTETKSIVSSTRIRLPWLFLSFLGGIVSIYIIAHFEQSIQKVAYLAAFIPIIMGMGGNIGVQSSTIVVRGIAMGRIDINRLGRVVSKELAVGLILGFIYAIILGTFAHFKYSTEALALSVGLGVMSSMTLAAFIGAFLPMIFAKMHVDPAVAAGPFVTSSIDILSITMYFQVATILLGI